jgi:mannosyltransferase
MASGWHQFAAATTGPARLAERSLPAAPPSGTGKPAGRHRTVLHRHRLPEGLVLVVPAAAELAIGGYQLGAPALWGDERAYLDVARRPAAGIVDMLSHSGAAHGFYYLFLHCDVVVLGTSAVALRLPSLLAAVATVALTAALGRRLARQCGIPAPSVVALLAGLILVAMPAMTFGARDTGPYAFAALAAVAATYCLVRAVAADGQAWWAGYCVSLVLLGLAEDLALLLIAAHGISLLLAAARSRRQARGFSGRGRIGGRVMPGELSALAADAPVGPAGAALRGWLIAGGGAVLALTPLAWATARQPAEPGWPASPGLVQAGRLVAGLAGTAAVVPLLALLAVAAVVAERHRGGGGRTVAGMTVPWLAVPLAALVGAAFGWRAVPGESALFCLPALALLAAAGLVWVVCWTGAAAGERLLRASGLIGAGLGALIIAVMIALLAGPQLAARHAPRTAGDSPAVLASQAGHRLAVLDASRPSGCQAASRATAG